jgi:hypothetical protein
MRRGPWLSNTSEKGCQGKVAQASNSKRLCLEGGQAYHVIVADVLFSLDKCKLFLLIAILMGVRYHSTSMRSILFDGEVISRDLGSRVSSFVIPRGGALHLPTADTIIIMWS